MKYLPWLLQGVLNAGVFFFFFPYYGKCTISGGTTPRWLKLVTRPKWAGTDRSHQRHSKGWKKHWDNATHWKITIWNTCSSREFSWNYTFNYYVDIVHVLKNIVAEFENVLTAVVFSYFKFATLAGNIIAFDEKFVYGNLEPFIQDVL